MAFLKLTFNEDETLGIQAPENPQNDFPKIAASQNPEQDLSDIVWVDYDFIDGFYWEIDSDQRMLVLKEGKGKKRLLQPKQAFKKFTKIIQINDDTFAELEAGRSFQTAIPLSEDLCKKFNLPFKQTGPSPASGVSRSTSASSSSSSGSYSSQSNTAADSSENSANAEKSPASRTTLPHPSQMESIDLFGVSTSPEIRSEQLAPHANPNFNRSAVQLSDSQNSDNSARQKALIDPQFTAAEISEIENTVKARVKKLAPRLPDAHKLVETTVLKNNTVLSIGVPISDSHNNVSNIEFSVSKQGVQSEEFIGISFFECMAAAYLKLLENGSKKLPVVVKLNPDKFPPEINILTEPMASQVKSQIIEVFLKCSKQQNIPAGGLTEDQIIVRILKNNTLQNRSRTSSTDSTNQSNSANAQNNKKNKELRLDDDTEAKNQKLNAKEIFIGKNGNPPVNYYRLNVNNKLKKAAAEVKPISQNPIFNERVYVSTRDAYAKFEQCKDDDVYYAETILEFTKPGERVALPSLSTQDKIQFIQCNKQLKLEYCKEQDLYYVTQLGNDFRSKLPISFVVKASNPCKATNKSPDNDKTITDHFINLQFDDCGNVIKNKSFDELNKLAPYELFNKLTAFCQHFEPGKLSHKPTDDIDKLNTIISERKGVCRHRALAFAALADAFDKFDYRVVSNGVHAFVEVSEKGKNTFQSICLGGADVDLQLEKLPKKREVLFTSEDLDHSIASAGTRTDPQDRHNHELRQFALTINSHFQADQRNPHSADCGRCQEFHHTATNTFRLLSENNPKNYIVAILRKLFAQDGQSGNFAGNPLSLFRSTLATNPSAQPSCATQARESEQLRPPSAQTLGSKVAQS